MGIAYDAGALIAAERSLLTRGNQLKPSSTTRRTLGLGLPVAVLIAKMLTFAIS